MSQAMTQPMLQVQDLHAGYGKTNVLHGVSFHVDAGECVALVLSLIHI